MRIQGSQTLDAPRADVFAAVCDPQTLLAVIPGCRALERVSDDEYRGEISLRLPGFAGSYRTAVRLLDADEPNGARLEGEVAGRPGSIKGRAAFWLEDADDGTQISYDGQAVIGGPLARLDGRFAEALARTLINQGLGRLNVRLQRAPVSIGNEEHRT